MREFVTAGIGLGVGAVLVFVAFQTCKDAPLGEYAWKSDKVSDGYVLIAPYHIEAQYGKPGEVLLVDTDGKTVHRWETRYQTLAAYLQPNGHIYAAMTPPINPADYPSGGSTGLIQELDWEGNVIWEHSDRYMTHDFEIMPDGGVAYIRWHKVSANFASKIRGGKPIESDAWANELVVVDRDKNLTWTWRPEEHIDPSKFPLHADVPRNDWTHINSIRYTASNPISGTPAFLISARHLNAIFIIDAASGEVIWHSREGMMATQHDASFLDDGTILLFDNGYLGDSPVPVLISRVIQIDPLKNEVVWQYPDPSKMGQRILFADSLMSGAQRLPNGNTLITGTVARTILEVTPGREIVWRYTSDFTNEDGGRIIFKNRKYVAEGTEWAAWLERHGGGFCPR